MAASLIRNITWLGFGSIVVKPIWFVFITYICYESIGTNQYGVMTAALSLMAILGGISSLGTSQYTIREIARSPEQSAAFLSNLFPIRLFAGLVAIGLGLLLSTFLVRNTGGDIMEPPLQPELLTYAFAGVYALGLNLTEYCRSFFRAHQTLKDEAISIIVEKILTVSLGTLVLIQLPTATGALAGIAAGIMLTFILNLVWIQQKFAAIDLKLIDKTFIKKSLRIAFPLGMVSIFVLIYFRTDSVMLQSIKGDMATGQYGIAFRILEALLLFPGIIVAVLLPRLSTLFTEGISAHFHALLKKSVMILSIFGIATAASIAILAGSIVGLLEEGSAAEPATLALQILVWTFPFASVNYIFSSALTASDDQKALAWMLGIAVILNITLNLILIPDYSLYGASVATLLTQMTVSLAMIWRYFSLLKGSAA